MDSCSITHAPPTHRSVLAGSLVATLSRKPPRVARNINDTCECLLAARDLARAGNPGGRGRARDSAGTEHRRICPALRMAAAHEGGAIRRSGGACLIEQVATGARARARRSPWRAWISAIVAL